MEAERLVPELPGTTPFKVAAGEPRSTSLTCASASRGVASTGGILSPTSTLENGSAAGLPCSADARTEQAFFGNFLPVSSGLRCAFMRRCPSAPSELSAADQQRLLQQQRLHVHLLQLERKVSMQERLLCQVQKHGEAPAWVQQQGAADQQPATADEAQNVPSCQKFQCVSRKRDDVDKDRFPPSRSTALLSENGSLPSAEVPFLTLPAQQRDVSISGGIGGVKGASCAALEKRSDEVERAQVSGVILRTDAADDDTPSTATVSERSPASDERAITTPPGGSTKSVSVAASSMAAAGAHIDCCTPSSTKDISSLSAGVCAEHAEVGCTFPAVEHRAIEKAREEREDESTAGSTSWHSLAAADPQANRLEDVTGKLPVSPSSELQSAQQSIEPGSSLVRAEVCQENVEKEGGEPAEKLTYIGKAFEGEQEKKTSEVAGGSVPGSHIDKAREEEHGGLVDTTGGRKQDATRPPDQFYRIKLCAKYMRRTCRRGSLCSYAHAKEELREIPNLWKTKLCATHKQGKPCPLDSGCPFAHGEEELRCTPEYYKTKLCKFWMREGRCEAGEGCRHAHGAAELRQRTYWCGEVARGGLRMPRQESLQVPEATSEAYSGSKDESALGTSSARPVSPPGAAPVIGKRNGTGVPVTAKVPEQKAPAGWCGSKNDRSRTSSGQLSARHTQQSPFRQNESEGSGTHRRKDAAQGAGATAQQRTPSKVHKKGKGEGECRSSGKGGAGDAGSVRVRVKRRGGKGGGSRACENNGAGSTCREGEASASATLSRTVRSATASCQSNSGGKEVRRRSNHGSSHQHHGGGGRGGERRDNFAPPVHDKRRSTIGSHGAQPAPPSYHYRNLNKNGQAHSFCGGAPGQDHAEVPTLHAQHQHAQQPRVQHQQQTQVRAQKFPVHMAETSASALYELTAGINPYGAFAACQQQAPYGLSLLSAGPPSCGNLQTAAAAAAAVAAIAQQQQQLEAAAKAVGTPVYQSMPFLGHSHFPAFTPSHLSYAAPAPAPPSPFAASPVGAGGSAAVRSYDAAYAACSYPVYPYSTPGPSSLVTEANGGAAAPRVSSSYSPSGLSVPCSACSYDAGVPEVCLPLSEREDLQANGVQTDTREAGSTPGRYITQGRSLTAAAAGRRAHAAGALVERATLPYPCQWTQEDGSRCSYRKECGTYTDTPASVQRPREEDHRGGMANSAT